MIMDAIEASVSSSLSQSMTPRLSSSRCDLRSPPSSPRSMLTSSSRRFSYACLLLALAASSGTIYYAGQVSLSTSDLDLFASASKHPTASLPRSLAQGNVSSPVRSAEDHTPPDLSGSYRGPSLGPPISSFSWQDSSVLPNWMKDYFRWHIEERSKLTPDNYRNSTTQLLILRCLRELDPKCGGASDRLQLIPFALLIAYQSKRLLLIQWTRPHSLEEFLVPNGNGINWTVPEWMTDIPYRRQTITGTRQMERQLLNQAHSYYNQTIVDMRHQSADYGKPYYDEYANRTGGLSFNRVYQDVWQSVFKPSSAVQERLWQHSLISQPQEYISLHIRSMYVRNTSAQDQIIRNAVHCAYQMARDQSMVDQRTHAASALFIATDSLASTEMAVKYAQRFFSRVETRSSDLTNAQPLHLDRGTDFLNAQRNPYWLKHPPSEFFDVFEDLYLLAGGRCNVYGLGGYGRWAAALSRNHSCVYNHAKRSGACPMPKGVITPSSRTNQAAAAATS